MTREPKTLRDGWISLEGGMDSGRDPSILGNNQVAFARNVTLRGGFPKSRPGWIKQSLTFESTTLENTFKQGKFQGAKFFDLGTNSHFIVSISGNLWRLYIDGRVDLVAEIDRNSARRPLCWMEQVENTMVVQDGLSKPALIDSTTARRAGDTEVPVGTAMAYGLGRLWVALPDGRQFVAGDLYGTSTGPLKFTENDYLNEGGAFSVAMTGGYIKGMMFTATPDTSLGTGALLVFTDDTVVSVDASVNRDDWKNLNYPIQRIQLIHYGSLSDASLTSVNSDIFMRSRDGIRSVIAASRDFGSWGNTPLSQEMDRLILQDDPRYLGFSSSILFNNRLLFTVSPTTDQKNVYHRGLIALDFNLMGSIGSKSAPAYDGMWNGTVFPIRLVNGTFNEQDRAFMFALNASSEIEFWEISKDERFDNDGDGDMRISAMMESRALNFNSPLDGKMLERGEIGFDRVAGLVDFTMYYKPDQYPCWRNWETWCAEGSYQDCTDDSVINDYKELYEPRKLLHEPSDECESNTGRPYRLGNEFQVRLEWNGHARIKRFVGVASIAEEDISS